MQKTGLKDKSESKLLREEKIPKVVILPHDFFFLENILPLNKHSSYMYTNFIAICLIICNLCAICLNFIKNSLPLCMFLLNKAFTKNLKLLS